MVNIGRPSQGCFTCKERRVKCDLEKPYCRRCTSSRRKCAGYPEVWALMHRQQNAVAQKHVQARVEQKTAERLEQAAKASTAVPRSIHIGAEVYSLNRFYADYSINSGITFFNILPELYGNGSEMCFQEAMHAVSLASSSRQLCQSGLMVQARRHYGRAITALNIGLCDPVRAKDDSLLVTLFLFGLFELMEMFISRASCPPLWSSLEEFTLPWSNGPILEPVLRRAVDFKMRIQVATTVPSHELPAAGIIQLIKSGICVSEDLEAAATLIGLSRNSAHDLGQLQTVFNGLLVLSTETTEAIARCLYRCVRFHIVEMILDLLASLNDRCDDASREFTAFPDLCDGTMILEQIYEEIRNVFGLDGRQHPGVDQPGIAYRTFCMFWPLMLALTSSFAGDDKKLWAVGKLRYIGETSGIGLAVNAAGGVSRPYSC